MEPNCRVWSKERGEFLNALFCMRSGGEIWIYSGVLERWILAGERMIEDLGLSFYPGV